MVEINPLIEHIEQASLLRNPFAENTNVYRLFNGFYEGRPGLVIDRFGSTLVISNHLEKAINNEFLQEIIKWAIESQPWLTAILLKQRRSSDANERFGQLLNGIQLSSQVNELGIRYALNLQLHQDPSFYIDTRNLRQWLKQEMASMRILNTFAYTGSLGIAACAAGALQVLQTDHNRKFLNLAERSWQ